jgi:thymidylate synthase (FAD)
MFWVSPSVHFIGMTEPRMDAIRQYLKNEFKLDWTPELIASLGGESSILAAIAGKRCYRSFVAGLNPNVTKTRTEIDDYFENIFQSGHGSVLEHINFTFAFEGVSRVFTHELVRHRVGVAISQESLRYVRLGKLDPIPMRLRPSLDQDESETRDPETGEYSKESQTLSIMEEAVAAIEIAYQKLLDLWDVEKMTNFAQKKVMTSMMRDILPQGMATGMIWTVNARALRNIFDQRLSPFAEEEIRHAMVAVLQFVKDACPALFADYTITFDDKGVPQVVSDYGGI